MKKNTFGRYREDLPSDAYEDVLDAETREVKKDNVTGGVKKLVDWAVDRRGAEFVNRFKQYKAISKMKAIGLTPQDIKERYMEIEIDPYWKRIGFDFMNILVSFDKKPLIKT